MGLKQLSKDKYVEIKKYPNRRLYNTIESRYITLEDLAQMIREDRQFKVLDSKTQEDVTRITVIQIILNQELDGLNVLPLELIKQLIKLYNNPISKTFNEFLLNAMQQFNANSSMYKDIINPQQIPQQAAEWNSYIQKINESNTEIFMNFFNQISGKK